MQVQKKLRSESGASAVEFALLLPVLMMILFGIIEFGLALYRQAILTNASREGARLGIVQSVPAITTAQIDARIDNYLTPAGIIPGNVTHTISSRRRHRHTCDGHAHSPLYICVAARTHVALVPDDQPHSLDGDEP